MAAIETGEITVYDKISRLSTLLARQKIHNEHDFQQFDRIIIGTPSKHVFEIPPKYRT